MKLVSLTLVLDGEPWIEQHLPEFSKMTHPWEWRVIHGAAMNGGSTKWCRPQVPRLSNDGTTQYLNSINYHPCVVVHQKPSWPSKDAMVNAPLDFIKEPCVLMQIDSDECWRAEQLDGIVQMFEELPYIMRAYFWCNFYVGPKIVAVSEDGWSNRATEWLRAWRFAPGMHFNSHEPPVLAGNIGVPASRDFTRSRGLVFEHHAYELEKQVKFKETYYRYNGALRNWRRLQSNTHWPVNDLKEFLPWVGPGVKAMLLR